jgi:hypothetical protein
MEIPTNTKKRKNKMVNPDLREKCPVCAKFEATRTGGGGCLDFGVCEEPKELAEPVEEEVEEVEESEEDLDAYLEELPVKELKKLLKDANLNTKGKKSDLVARLIE